MTAHIVRAGCVLGIAATAALVACHAFWARRLIREAEQGGRL